MLSFFRRIRKGLFLGGATSKYILYAIGEIALVVTGILIALQINIWNQERELRNTEKIYLNRIYDDVNSMLSGTAIFNDGQKYLDKTLKALKAVEKCSITEKEKVNLDEILNNHQALGLFPIKRTAYDEIVATGMMAQLKNDSLKTMISGLYSSIEVTQSRLEYFRDELGRASEVIMKHVQFTIVDREFSALSYNPNELCKNIQFRNAMVEVYDARSDVYYSGSLLREQLELTYKILEEELESGN